MVLKRKDPGRAYSPARKALSRSVLGGICRSPRRGMSTSFQASGRLAPCARPGGASKGPVRKGSANVKVVVRVRPLNQREKDNNARIVLDVVDDKMVVFDPKREEETFFFHGSKQKGRDMLKKQNKNVQFLFDRVFGPDDTNENVFEGSTKSIIKSVLDGFNSSVFVYGATGAGKTFTMLGTHENPGITFRTMVDLFKQMEEQKNEKDFEIGVSYLEVYNETVRDLLNPTSGALHLREDGGGVVVAGLKLERISDPEHMFGLLEHGNLNRTQHPTDANAESSRSHAVFQVFIKMKLKATAQTKMVKLSMIDLAGSERGAATGCAGVRFKEGSNINKSLLALGNCINALADGLRHIPYRDSKLTRLLKDSLGGNCQTVMIANVSPAHPTMEDTQNTLKYATRAKSIKCQIKQNVVSVELHVSHYIKMVEDLQAENDRLKKENESVKKELEEYRAQSQACPLPTDPPPNPSPVRPSMPPLLAAVVAEVSSKIKSPARTTSVAVNTSPLKGMLKHEDLDRLRDEAEKLYTEKARLHQRYLSMDSSDKVLRWRIKLKQRAIDRIQAMSSTPTRADLAQSKVDKSVNQFKGRLNSAYECLETVSVEEKEINERLQMIWKEVQRLGICDEAAPLMRAFELEYLNQELNIKCQHLEKLVEYLDKTFDSQDTMLQDVSSLFRKYYNLVKSNGHMTKDLLTEHEAVMRCLEGRKRVEWKETDLSTFHEFVTEDSVNMPLTAKPKPEVFSFQKHTSGSVQEVGCSAPSAFLQNIMKEDQDVKRQVILQSPLCSSSSNQTCIESNMETAAMLDSLGDLDSKVENILNTSVSSSAVDCIMNQDEEKQQPLNVTFDGESNMNSTFVKSETKVNLNETFEKPEEYLPASQACESDALNQTFEMTEPEAEAKPSNYEDNKLNVTFEKEDIDDDCSGAPQKQENLNGAFSMVLKPSCLPTFPSKQSSGISPTSLKVSSSNSQPLSSLRVSPLANRFSPSTMRRSPSGSPLASNITIPSKKPVVSGSSSLFQQSSDTLNKTVSLPASLLPNVKKTGVSPVKFAVPAAVAARTIVAGKRPLNSGVIDKRRALSSNTLPLKLGASKVTGVTKKPLGPPLSSVCTTPSSKAVKFALNKENRNATLMSTKPTSLKVSKSLGSNKLGVKPLSAPPALNDTFNK